jgi:hypothetical protein
MGVPKEKHLHECVCSVRSHSHCHPSGGDAGGCAKSHFKRSGSTSSFAQAGLKPTTSLLSDYATLHCYTCMQLQLCTALLIIALVEAVTIDKGADSKQNEL